jgi:uncharacterized membrane protein
MKAKARIFGHPVHLILIVFPLGLLATSFFFDLAYLAKGRTELAVVSSWMIFAGVLGGAAAAVFGLIDWLAIPRGTRAWRVGAWHGGGNLIVAALFAVSWCIRRDAPGHPEAIAIALSACGVLLIVLTGWLGSELADRMDDV